MYVCVYIHKKTRQKINDVFRQKSKDESFRESYSAHETVVNVTRTRGGTLRVLYGRGFTKINYFGIVVFTYAHHKNIVKREK